MSFLLRAGTTNPMVDLLLIPIAKFVKKLSTLGLSIQTCMGYLTVGAKLVVASIAAVNTSACVHSG